MRAFGCALAEREDCGTSRLLQSTPFAYDDAMSTFFSAVASADPSRVRLSDFRARCVLVDMEEGVGEGEGTSECDWGSVG